MAHGVMHCSGKLGRDTVNAGGSNFMMQVEKGRAVLGATAVR